MFPVDDWLVNKKLFYLIFLWFKKMLDDLSIIRFTNSTEHCRSWTLPWPDVKLTNAADMVT